MSTSIGKCSICLDNIKFDQAGFLRNCPHGFHRDCIARSLATSNHCPMCRCYTTALDIFTPIVDPPETSAAADVENAPNLAPLRLCDRISPKRHLRAIDNYRAIHSGPMENGPIDPPPMPKPTIHFCDIKIETAVKIAAILGLLLFTMLVLIGLVFAARDQAMPDFPTAFLMIFFALVMIFFGALIYHLPFMAIKKGQYLKKDKNGMMIQDPRERSMSLACILMVLFVLIFVVKTGYLLGMQRGPCESGQCPSWSRHCTKNLAQVLLFDPQITCQKSCKAYPNEGIVERVFETPDTARLLKRTILEMAANQTNVILSKEVLESQLGPYFDDLLHLELEMNCKRYWSPQPEICPEKAAKLKQAFMDVFWTQANRTRDQTTSPQPREITDDEIDSVFVVLRHCDSIRLALAISILFLIAHLAILVIFIRGLQLANWLDWATTCPRQCRLPASQFKTYEPCEHCPIRRNDIHKPRRHNMSKVIVSIGVLVFLLFMVSCYFGGADAITCETKYEQELPGNKIKKNLGELQCAGGVYSCFKFKCKDEGVKIKIGGCGDCKDAKKFLDENGGDYDELIGLGCECEKDPSKFLAALSELAGQ